jgi:outer membrane immunogenic protein
MLTYGAKRASTASALALCTAALTLSLPSTTANANPLAPIWTGVYFGFHGGAKWADVETDFSSTFSAKDWTGGGHLGYNVGLGLVVLGIEGDATLDSTAFGFSSAGGGTGTYETDWSGTIRARLGLPVGPALIYATAGYAWTESTLHETNALGTAFSSNHAFHGVVYGVGAETYILPNLSLRVEALRFDYASDKLSLTDAVGIVEEFDPSDTVVRAGITFHLN